MKICVVQSRSRKTKRVKKKTRYSPIMKMGIVKEQGRKGMLSFSYPKFTRWQPAHLAKRTL